MMEEWRTRRATSTVDKNGCVFLYFDEDNRTAHTETA
jgi:hypothetical protein